MSGVSDDAHLTGRMKVLVQELNNLFSKKSSSESTSLDFARSVENVMREFVSHAPDCFDDWKKYLFWSDVHYTRNLVFACEQFELIVLCWASGQGSRIHNHASSHCWLGVLSGVASEQTYQPCYVSPDGTFVAKSEAEKPVPFDTPDGRAPCPLMVLLKESTLQQGSVSYINDSIALHRVAAFHVSQRDGNLHSPRNLTPEGTVTLHLYSPPIKRVKLFEPGENHVYLRTPGFFSIHGVKH